MILAAEKAEKEYIRSRSDSNVLYAVAETDLILPEGTVTALYGPSGSGKSTLLNMFAGLLSPTRGKILLDDTDIYGLDDKELSSLRNKHIGLIPQGQTALYTLNAEENIMVPFTLYGKNRGNEYENIKKKAHDLMAEAGIENLASVMPSEMSGGEIRRMAVCRAMIMKPEIILADEPTGDLDEENTEIVMSMLKRHSSEGGTVFVVTHDRQVQKFADRLFEMKKGIISEYQVS